MAVFRADPIEQVEPLLISRSGGRFQTQCAALEQVVLERAFIRFEMFDIGQRIETVAEIRSGITTFLGSEECDMSEHVEARISKVRILLAVPIRVEQPRFVDRDAQICQPEKIFGEAGCRPPRRTPDAKKVLEISHVRGCHVRPRRCIDAAVEPRARRSAFDIAVLDEMRHGVHARPANIGIVQTIPLRIEQSGLLDESAQFDEMLGFGGEPFKKAEPTRGITKNHSRHSPWTRRALRPASSNIIVFCTCPAATGSTDDFFSPRETADPSVPP
jgi:hypothetical protein